MDPSSFIPSSEIRRFIVAGVINTATSYLVYALGLWSGLNYPLANLIALLVGVLVSFFTQGKFVFRKFEIRRFPAFVLLWALLWLLNVALIGLFLPLFARNAYLAGAAATVIIVGCSFLAQKYLVFAGGSRR